MSQEKPKKPLSLRQLKFIKMMIEVVDMEGQVKAYMKCFPKCRKKRAAETASYRLLRDVRVKEAVEAGKREKEDTIREAKRQERIRLAQQQVAHEFEIDAVMSDIVMRRQVRKKQQPVYNPDKKAFEMIVIEEQPTESDQVQAADKLYKRKGSYAATTVKHEGGDSFLNFFAAMAQPNNPNISNANTPSSESKI